MVMTGWSSSSSSSSAPGAVVVDFGDEVSRIYFQIKSREAAHLLGGEGRRGEPENYLVQRREGITPNEITMQILFYAPIITENNAKIT